MEKTPSHYSVARRAISPQYLLLKPTTGEAPTPIAFPSLHGLLSHWEGLLIHEFSACPDKEHVPSMPRSLIQVISQLAYYPLWATPSSHLQPTAGPKVKKAQLPQKIQHCTMQPPYLCTIRTTAWGSPHYCTSMQTMAILSTLLLTTAG